MKPPHLGDIVRRMSGKVIVVVGDAIEDVYHFGRVDRVSPEAPVPVFVHERTQIRVGGAAHVAAQVKAFGCTVREHVTPHGWRCKKHRYMVGSHLLLRVDYERTAPAQSSRDYKDLTDQLSGGLCLPRADVAIVSDYAKGWLTQERLSSLFGRTLFDNIPVVVDPKGGDWSRYVGASVVCPNEREYEAWTRTWAPPLVVLKRGALGIGLIEGHNQQNFPAKAQAVFDVTGAGDTVVATIGAALAAGADMSSACRLANLAAGYVVGIVGTAVCPLEKLLELAAEADQA